MCRSRKWKTENVKLEIGRILESQIRKQKSQNGRSYPRFLFSDLRFKDSFIFEFFVVPVSIFTDVVCCLRHMRKLVAAALLLLSLLSSNVWSLQLCHDTLPDVPDCCRNGFCPHHQQVEVTADSAGKDCVCKLSPDNHKCVLLYVIGPAILCTNLTGPLTPTSRFVDFRMFRATSFDQPTLSLPPKA